jgi:hypothetical protein
MTHTSPRAPQSSPAPTDGAWQPVPLLGLLCAASGALGVVVSVVTLAYPADVEDRYWSYPFGFTAGLLVGVVLAIVHLMTLAGVRGLQLTRADRRSVAERGGLGVVMFGFLLLATLEVAGGLIGRAEIDDVRAVVVSGAFGITSLLIAGGSLAVAFALRRGRESDAVRWLLASAAAMIVLVIPANVSGDLLFRMVTLMVWSLCFVPFGLAVRHLSRE